jgi:hypothetical protein
MKNPKIKLGRRPVADKKFCLRIFIEQSIIDANGGEQISKDECISFLKKRGQKKEKTKTDFNHKCQFGDGK